MRRALSVLSVAGLLLGAASLSEAAGTYGYRKALTIDQTKVAGTANHTNFPVLVSITNDNDLRTTANGGHVENANGYDIAFTAADGTTLLDFEIEHYDPSSGTLVAWVRIPDLPYNANTTIYVYYGNTAINTPQETSCAVWDSDYVGVWHLGESGNGSAAEYRDSSRYYNHGQGGQGDPLFVPSRVTGKIGYSQDFNIVQNRGNATVALSSTTVTFAGGAVIPPGIQAGDTLIIDPGGANEETFSVASRDSNTQVTVTVGATIAHSAEPYVLYDRDPKEDLVDVGNDVSLSLTGDQITLEVWVQHNIIPQASVGYGWINQKGWNSGYRMTLGNANLKASLALPGPTYDIDSATDITAGSWHHVVGTYDGATMRIYIDGVKDVNELARTGTLRPSAAEDRVFIGHADQPKDKSWSWGWEGQIDEMRISRRARSGDWIATEYNNQNDPSTFFLPIGAEEPVSQSLAELQINQRSIGRNSGILYDTDFASITTGTTTVTLSGPTPPSLPVNVGPGDQLVLDPGGGNQEILYVLSRDSAVQLTVQSPAIANHSAEAYEIRRVYNTLQAWEQDIFSSGRGGDLVGDNRREIGVMYDDGLPFTDNLVIDGSTTDCLRFMHLTAGPGQRHDGTAGTGVVLTPSAAGHAITVQDDSTRIEWLEITGWSGDDSEAIRINADNTFYSDLLVHDPVDPCLGGDCKTDGFFLQPNSGDWTANIDNSIIYNVDRAGIQLQNDVGSAYLTYRLDNVTLHGNGNASATSSRGGGISLCEVEGTTARIQARNVISMGNIDDDGDGDGDFNLSACVLYNTGDASVGLGSATVTFGSGASLPEDIDESDKLILDPGGPNQEIFYVQSRDSATQVTVESVATLDHSVPESYLFERGRYRHAYWTSEYNMSADGSAPGRVRFERTTDPAGNSGTTVVVASGTFVSWGILAGDWFLNETDGTSSRIASVDSETQLTLVETGVTGNSKDFTIRRSARHRVTANQFVSPGTDFHLKAGSDALDTGTDLSTRFCCDIDGALRPEGSAWDMGADEYLATTAVELTYFRAFGLDEAASIEWQTASELDNLGFHLYRSTSLEGPYERLTSSPIPGLGSSPVGAQYRFRDEGLSNGVTYYYELEDIETSGRTKRHGPVAVKPTETESQPPIEGAPSEDESPSSVSLITYGQPEANGLRLLSHEPGSLVLELRTEGFYAEPVGDGSVRIRIPGFQEGWETDWGRIPVKHSWIDAVAGKQVQIRSIEPSSQEWIEGLKPSAGEIVELVASPEGTVRFARRARRGTGRSPSPSGLLPSEQARVVSVGFQGEVKKALVELAPLQWDAAAGRWLLSRLLVVRLVFAGRESSESTLDGNLGRRYRERASHAERQVAARLVTRERGLYALRYESLFPPKARVGLSERLLRLSRRGETVAIHLEPRTSVFGPGSTLYFMSEGADANPHGNEAVFELALGKPGEMMEVSSGTPSGVVHRHSWHRLELEENRFYQAALLEAPDLWLWDVMLAPARKSYAFEVSELAPAPHPAYLVVWLQGASDLQASPDHHVRVFVNDSLVQETSWDGKQARRLEAELLPGLLREGDNVLEIENVGDTGASYSMVMLNRFAVDYLRSSTARSGVIQASWNVSGTAEVSGLTQEAVVLDTTEASPRWLTGVEVSTDGVARFRVEAGHRYVAWSSRRLLEPDVRQVPQAVLKKTTNQADYLVIAPSELLGAAASLLASRQREGLAVRGVSLEDIGSEFGYGELGPESIKDFLSYAYHQWRRPSPRYVLLLGDATYDPKDYLGTGVRNQVPPWMLKTSYLWTASDPAYAAVNGEDLLPDMAIGRLPAATVEEAQALVSKILAYEEMQAAGGVGPFATVTLVADNPDDAGNFVGNAEEIAASLLSGRSLRKIYLSEIGVEPTRRAIAASLDEGTSLLSYLGHGGIHLWADENIWNRSDVALLAPQAQQPLMLTMNCLNGYFHFPYFNSLAEELLKAEERGVIAAISPSGLSLNEPAHRLHKALLNELLHGDHVRLGDVMMAAQERYSASGAFPELLSIYHLLGDPALKIR